MPQFIKEWNKETTVKITRKRVFYLCVFRLPEDLKEQTPYSAFAGVESDLVMGFYSDPVPGDTLTYCDLDWIVLRRHYYPVKYQGKGPKLIARLELDFIGGATD